MKTRRSASANRALGLCAGTFLLALGVVLPTGTARAEEQEGNTEDVRGTLASTQVVGTACSSPIGLCTEGTLTGDLAGTFFYTAASMVVLSDGVTGIFDGTFVLQTRGGVLTEHDHTIANLRTGQLVDVDTILSGTGEWEGASGAIYVQGIFNFATGAGASTYQGTVFLPEHDR